MFIQTTTIQNFWNNYLQESKCTLEIFKEACECTDLAVNTNNCDYWFSAEELYEQYMLNRICKVNAINEGNYINITVSALDGSFSFEICISFDYTESELFNYIIDKCK